MKHPGHIIAFAFILFLFPNLTSGQTPVVSTSVNKKTILIGEQIDLSIGITMPDNRYRLSWVTFPDDFGTFILASKDNIDTAYQTGVLRYRQTFHITSFDSGRQVIPPLAFQLETLSQDSAFTMFTDSIPIDVRFSPADSILPFHDIKPILLVKKERLWWFWPAIIAGILLFILLLIFYLRYRKRKKSSQVFDSAISDYDEAIQALDGLERENLPAKGAFKSYFLRLTDIFKKYISHKSLEDKMHLTGDETIVELSHRTSDRKLIEEFASCVRMADAVKFAKFTPTIQESEACLQQIRMVIETLNKKETTPKDDL